VAEQALAIALYCALVAPTIEAALLLAVNHGGDSDSTGAIAGQLVGAIYGEESIPPRWLARLELQEAIERVAEALCVETGASAA
jgi:ADP-ribosylglycohydrolase